MIKTVCAKFRKQNHPNNTLFVFLLTRGRLFVTKSKYIYINICIIIMDIFADPDYFLLVL